MYVDSVRTTLADSIANADSLAQLGLELETEIVRPGLLGSAAAEHPFIYNTSYSILRNRRSWNQDARFYVSAGNLALANRTTITILEDPAVRRQTRNRGTEFELGYQFFSGMTSGLRFSALRNSDIIGISLRNSIERETDKFSAFTRFERVLLRFPSTLDLSIGRVKDRQPEFTRSGQDLGLNFTASGPLLKNVDLNTGAILSSSRVVSESPIDDGTGNFTSNDQSFDRSGRLGLNWRPNSLLTISTNGAIRRGVLQRPETIFDQSTGQPTTVSEQVTTDAQNGDITMRFSAPWGGSFSATGRLNSTEILYDVDSTRNNVNNGRNFNLTAQNGVLGADVNFTFQTNLSESDYTSRPDGYVQSQWNRSMELRANRKINSRTTSNLRGAISLNSRRFEDFRPSGPTSFPPADQDLFRASGAVGIDYRPWTKFNTGLEGRLDNNQTINLPATASINNTDQTSYNIVWRWTATPLNFWTLTQNNTAGAIQIAYPFAPSRDQLSFIYQLRTTSTMVLTRKITFEMHYNVRYQSRGSFREEEPGSESRLFGKTGGAEQFDLLLRLVYRPLPWLNGELSQQSFVSRNLSEVDGVERINTENERNTFAFRVAASHNFVSGSTLSFNVRRSLTSDENRINTFIPTPAIVREDDLWQVTSSFRTFFDF